MTRDEFIKKWGFDKQCGTEEKYLSDLDELLEIAFNTGLEYNGSKWNIVIDSGFCPHRFTPNDEPICYHWNIKTRRCQKEDCPVKK